MVVVYPGLGRKDDYWYKGKLVKYDWDTAGFMVEQIKIGMPKVLMDQVIFVVPLTWDMHCATCLFEAEQLINNRGGLISRYSLCGFSRGGIQIYWHPKLRPWHILGLIDPVSPTMEGYPDNKVVDNFATRIRCVYNGNNWDCAEKIVTFYDYLTALNVETVERTDVQHRDMPALFFKTYGWDLIL
jgi:hypothetical protein